MNFFVGDLDLKADDISILDFTPGEGVLRFHEVYHAWFDFLGKDAELAVRVDENTC